MNKVYFGDCRDSLRQMAVDGIRAQMCVTSPPYYGLRDYGHEGQLGLEATPDEYITNMVEVFRGVRDVLADDGTLWLNIGDSYASPIKGSGGAGKSTLGPNRDLQNIGFQKMAARRFRMGELKQKDLIGIPWMLAFALRADGWYLRQDIIWHKPNPMPESVTDRCTKAHEYIFLLSKSPRYFYDAGAIAEPSIYPLDNRKARVNNATQKDHAQVGTQKIQEGSALYETRNKRSVWTVATTPYSGAHFATFPTALIEPCIMAGSKIGDIVLDPFFGSGTTGQVAMQLGRRYIGCELNPAYEALQRERTRQPSLDLTAA